MYPWTSWSHANLKAPPVDNALKSKHFFFLEWSYHALNHRKGSLGDDFWRRSCQQTRAGSTGGVSTNLVLCIEGLTSWNRNLHRWFVGNSSYWPFHSSYHIQLNNLVLGDREDDPPRVYTVYISFSLCLHLYFSVHPRILHSSNWPPSTYTEHAAGMAFIKKIFSREKNVPPAGSITLETEEGSASLRVCSVSAIRFCYSSTVVFVITSTI